MDPKEKTIWECIVGGGSVKLVRIPLRDGTRAYRFEIEDPDKAEASPFDATVDGDEMQKLREAIYHEG